MDPVQVAQAFVDAFNARDVERTVACFSEDAIIQDDTGNVFAHGEEAIRAHFGKVISQSPNVRVEILSRIHVGSWVVHEEHTTGLVLEELVPGFHIPAAYRVEDGKIVKCLGLM